MKLEKVGHLYEPQETENYLLRQRNGNGVIIDKRTSEKKDYAIKLAKISQIYHT